MSYLKYDTERIKCKCKECGRTFLKGDEEDNEELCLKCEHYDMVSEECDDYLD